MSGSASAVVLAAFLLVFVGLYETAASRFAASTGKVALVGLAAGWWSRLDGRRSQKDDAAAYCGVSVNVTVTVITTGIGSPFRNVGVNRH